MAWGREQETAHLQLGEVFWLNAPLACEASQQTTTVPKEQQAV
jgi:hypothetical protein